MHRRREDAFADPARFRSREESLPPLYVTVRLSLRERLEPALKEMISAFERLEKEKEGVVAVGRARIKYLFSS